MTNYDDLIERGKAAAEDLLEEGLSAYARDIDALVATVREMQADINHLQDENEALATENKGLIEDNRLLQQSLENELMGKNYD